MFSRLNSLGVLLLCSTQLLGQPQIAPKILAPPENPVTLDQLRRFEDVAAITEVTHGLLQRGFLQQKSQLPPWWPETIWNEMVENILKVDKVAIDLPFYQQCYSQQEARFFIHLFETPGGHAYARHMVGLEAEKIGDGASVSDARTSMMSSQPGLDPAMIKTLDQEDQRQAQVVFGTHRSADITACVGNVSPKALEIFQAKQVAVVQAVVEAHSSELDAAESKYNLEHANKTAK